MTKNNLLFLLISIICVRNCNAQEDTDADYKYEYKFFESAGLHDKSDIYINKSTAKKTDTTNFIGKVIWIQKAITDSTNIRNNDSTIYVPSRATLILTNKKQKIELYLSETFDINIPIGSYKMKISKTGMGFINRHIKIKRNIIYNCEIHLKSRRSISQSIYRCKYKMTSKELKSIKRHYKSPKKYEFVEPNCDCIYEFWILG